MSECNVYFTNTSYLHRWWWTGSSLHWSRSQPQNNGLYLPQLLLNESFKLLPIDCAFVSLGALITLWPREPPGALRAWVTSKPDTPDRTTLACPLFACWPLGTCGPRRSCWACWALLPLLPWGPVLRLWLRKRADGTRLLALLQIATSCRSSNLTQFRHDLTPAEYRSRLEKLRLALGGDFPRLYESLP